MPTVSWSGPITATQPKLGHTTPRVLSPLNVLKHFGLKSYVAFLEILSACTYYLITIFHKWVTFLPHDRWPFKANTTVTKQEKAQLKLSTVYKHSSQWSSYRSVDLFWHLLLDQEQCFRTTRASSQYLLYICMNETISSTCTLDSPSLSLCCVAEQSGCRMHFG